MASKIDNEFANLDPVSSFLQHLKAIWITNSNNAFVTDPLDFQMIAVQVWWTVHIDQMMEGLKEDSAFFHKRIDFG